MNYGKALDHLWSYLLSFVTQLGHHYLRCYIPSPFELVGRDCIQELIGG